MFAEAPRAAASDDVLLFVLLTMLQAAGLVRLEIIGRSRNDYILYLICSLKAKCPRLLEVVLNRRDAVV